jgi:hypothetical protein
MSTITLKSLTVGDRIAIHDLVAAYSWLCDTGELDDIPELFAEHGVFDEQVLGVPRCEGREAVKGLFHAMNDAEIPFIIHMISNERVSSYDGSQATGTCHLHAQGQVNGNPLDVFGYYADEYIKLDSRWLFSSRTLVALTPTKLIM